MKTRKQKRTLVEETLQGSPLKVDRENRVIRGVKILGNRSKHGYEYSRAAMEEAASQYESVKVNVNDPSRDNPKVSRGFNEWIGKLKNVEVKNDGVYGDLHYLESHHQAAKLCEAAERMPDFGLSHVADVLTSGRGNDTVVESVGKVRSVDVVQRPATNTTLLEDHYNVKTTTVKAILKKRFKKTWKAMEAVFEDEPAIMDAPVETMEPAEGGDETANSEAEMKEAFKSMIAAAFDDDSLDMKATIKRIREMIKAYYKLIEEPEPEESDAPPEDDAPADDAPAEEKEEPVEEEEDDGVRCKRLEREIEIRDLLEENDVSVTSARVKALVLMEDEDDIQEVIDAFPKRNAKAGGRPDRDERGLPTKRPRTSVVQEEEDEEDISKLPFAEAVSFR